VTVTIKKAVIAVAGFGTRFLPATKVLPKELMPIVDKPVVQYLVEEAVAAGIEDIILVTRPGSQGIADHFDSSRELEIHLEEQKKDDYLKAVKRLPELAHFAVVRQSRHLPYGNGTPLLAAQRFLGNEPFVYMFGDDLVLGDVSCTRELVDLYDRFRPDAVVAAEEVPREETKRYGIVKLKPGTNPPEMETLVEKPDPERAPSRLAQFGRFILPPRVIELLEKTALNRGELYLADAIDTLCREGGRVLVHRPSGTWYTMGDPLNFLKATVAYALKDPEIGKGFAEFLRTLRL
jgi:UTP--glucose-1-phosphate uridylyltransferase